MSNILVTAIGSFSGATVIKELKQNGHFVIGCDIHPQEWIIESNYTDLFIKSPYYSSKEYVDFIEKSCKANMIEYVFPLTDPEVVILSKYKDYFKEKNITICTSDYDTIVTCKDKYLLPKYLKDENLCNTIETYILTELNTNKISYPFFSKPRNGRSSEECMLIHDDIDLEYLCKRNINNKYIIQPYINGNVITVDIVRDGKNNKVICVPRRELIRTKSGAGTTVEIIQNKELVTTCENIANKLNIIGAVNMEFIERDDGKLFFLEINPRFSAGIAFTQIAGFQIVSQHLNCFINKPIQSLANIRNLLICKEYKECIIKEE